MLRTVPKVSLKNLFQSIKPSGRLHKVSKEIP